MEIRICTGVGKGANSLSAFDDALYSSGVSNYNLVYLSSIIPPSSDLYRVGKYEAPPTDYGKRLYVVRACETSETPDTVIAAVVAWYQIDDGSGFFVEHHGSGSSDIKQRLIAEAKISLEEMCVRRNMVFEAQRVNFEAVATQVENIPSCALVLAVFKTEAW
jgi:arginine decarboxylase